MSDKFSEKYQRGTGGVIFNPKINIADLRNFKQGFLIMKSIQKSDFRVQCMFFSTIVLILTSSVFSDLFHEGLHDGTTSNAQNHELERSRPVVMLKLNIIVTSMMETSFSTLLKKNTIVIKIEKWQM